MFNNNEKSTSSFLITSEQSKQPADLTSSDNPLPDNAQTFKSNGQFTYGDSHANLLAILEFLKTRKVLEFKEGDYTKLTGIYQAFGNKAFGEETVYVDHSSCLNTLGEYCQILEKTTFNANPHAVVRLLGDELHDRGNNDCLTLLMIKYLVEKNIPMETLLSNHAAYILRPLFEPSPYGDFMDNGQGQSLGNLQVLIDEGIVMRDEIDEILRKYYIPQLKLLSYSINDKTGTMSIYSHAPIGVPVIEAIAKKLGVQFDSSTQNNLADTIEMINIEFQKILAEAKSGNFKRFNNIFPEEGPGKIDSNNKKPFVNPIQEYLIYSKYPLAYLTWNTHHAIHNQENQPKNLNIPFVHGHHFQLNCGAINLDNNLGKSNCNSTLDVILAGGAPASGQYSDYYTPGWSPSRAIYKLRQAGCEVTRDVVMYLLENKDTCQQLEEASDQEKIKEQFESIKKSSQSNSSSSTPSSSSSSSTPSSSSSSSTPSSSSSSSFFDYLSSASNSSSSSSFFNNLSGASSLSGFFGSSSSVHNSSGGFPWFNNHH